MGTTLGDALACKGLVDQSRADAAANKLREEKEHRRRKAEEAEKRALRELNGAEKFLPPPEWFEHCNDGT